MADIPAGYQLIVESWENDADSPQTMILDGLTEADLHFYVSIVALFRSGSRKSSKTGNLGNEWQTPKVLNAIIDKALSDHPGISDAVRTAWTYTPPTQTPSKYDTSEGRDPKTTHYYDLLCANLLGYPESEVYQEEEPYFCRVFESCRVYYHPKRVEDVADRVGALLGAGKLSAGS